LKKICILLLMFMLMITAKAFAGQQDVIRLEVEPAVKNHQNPAVNAIQSTTYTAPLIEPAQTTPNVDAGHPSFRTINFNLGNIKNVKKGAIMPNYNGDLSITNISQYFNASYDKVFSHLLGILKDNNFEVVSCDSKSGRVFANYNGEKPVYITVSQYNSYNVLVKITPADGIYDIPASATDKVFADINKSLSAQ